jgi:hypothetical protein
LRDVYSNLLTQVTSDLADEGKQCRCALIGTLTAGINVCAFQKEDLKIPGSEDVRPQPVLGWDYAEGVSSARSWVGLC